MRVGWLIGAGLAAAAVYYWRQPLIRLIKGDEVKPAQQDRPAPRRPDGKQVATGKPPVDVDASYLELRAIAPAARYLDDIDEDGADAEYRAAVAGLGRRDV
ncbi:MAG TPA: hypothetical protein VL172_02610, partial [Kofleriaceae bacterium]|nr:hypothetical protein [Kofleriaceae bacterium]